MTSASSRWLSDRFVAPAARKIRPIGADFEHRRRPIVVRMAEAMT
jgi:hypothetical protein